MKFTGVTATLAAAMVATASAKPTTVSGNLIPRQAGSSELPVITQNGNAFFAGNDRFYLRGVAYQPGGEANVADPLLDIEGLTRDIQQFKKLGINCIRVYSIDNSQPHDEGMQMLADAGIYVALDANTPKFALNRADAASLHLSYNDRYLQSVFATIDNFASYSNLLLFFAGNEVINDVTNTNAAPYVKAVVRDMKTYIANRGYRAIPVGYAAADVADNIQQQLLYMDCGADIARTDFFGLNDYSWCDPSSFQESGWDAKVQRYSSYGSPLFLAEYGCITNTREWEEVKSIYSTQMSSVYSGGLAYEYTLEPNGYGLVELGANGQIQPNADFDRLRQQFASTPDPSGDGGARTGATASECPPQSEFWAVANLTIPAPPASISRFMDEGAGPGPGLPDDDSSQWGASSADTSNYSESWIEMDGSQPTGTNANSDNASNSSGNGPNAASAVQALGLTMTVIISSMLGAFLVL